MSKILESGFESVVLTLLAEMGFSCHGGDAFDPDASGERESYHGAMLPGRLKAAVARINPDLPPEAVEAAANAVLDFRFTEMIQENQRIHRLLVDGVPVEYQRGGETIHDRARLVDWKDEHNEWLAVNQFTVVGANKRRTDVLIFLNGLPLVVMELKGPESKNADIVSAYNQIQTYKADIPALFRTNLMSVLSDGFAARYGTLSADFDRHMAWRTVDGESLANP